MEKFVSEIQDEIQIYITLQCPHREHGQPSSLLSDEILEPNADFRV